MSHDHAHDEPLSGAFDPSRAPAPSSEAKQLAPTTADIWGPFFVRGAPFRCAIAPVWAKGRSLVVRGVVCGESGEPLPFATMEFWQTSPDAEYDYFEPDGVKRPYLEEYNMHGAAKEYLFRARTVTDENGVYEFHSKMPVPYFDPDDSTWRCPHIHYHVQKQGYVALVTQLYFEGEDKNDTDAHIDASRTIKLEHSIRNNTEFLAGRFDVVLKKQ